MTRRVTSSVAARSSSLFLDRSTDVASEPCVRANCTTAATPSLVISLPEKSSSVIGKGLMRSVAKPVVLDILQRITARGQNEDARDT